MITTYDICADSYEESKRAGYKGSFLSLLDDMLYLIFVYEDGDIIEKEILSHVKSYTSLPEGKFAYLTSYGELHVVDAKTDKVIDKDGRLHKIDSFHDGQIFAFSRSGIKSYWNGAMTLDIELDIPIQDCKIVGTHIPSYVYISQGRIFVSHVDIGKCLKHDTKGVLYLRFGKRGCVITHNGVVIRGRQYVFNTQPKEIVPITEHKYAVLFNDALVVIAVQDAENFVIHDYPLTDIHVSDIDSMSGILLLKADDGVGVADLL